MSFDPKQDGVTHINVYSKAKTKLGLALSNFSPVLDLQTPDGQFQSVEGYWYWLGVDPKNARREELRYAFGANAKKLGRELRADDWNESEEFISKIKFAIKSKIRGSLEIQEAMIANDLPYVHYYLMYGRVIVPTSGTWLIAYITELAEQLKTGIF
jgi:hypothetical protein